MKSDASGAHFVQGRASGFDTSNEEVEGEVLKLADGLKGRASLRKGKRRMAVR